VKVNSIKDTRHELDQSNYTSSMISYRCAAVAACFMNAKQFRRLLYWCAYTVVVPMGFVGLLWVTAWLAESAGGSFGEVFGTGDLLPVGALLLFTVSADIRLEDDGKAGAWMAVDEVLFIVVAIGAITIYGPMRAKAFELMKSGSAETAQSLRLYATLSWLYVGYAVLHTVPVKAMLLRNCNVRVSNGT
jgi:hypothetical protein